MKRFLCVMLALALCLAVPALAEPVDGQADSELGYDDEIGYGQPYYGFVESVLLPGQQMELIQSTSDGQAIRECVFMDGVVTATNCTFEPLYELDELDETAAHWAAMITSGQFIGGEPDPQLEPYDFSLAPDAAFSEKTSYPCYLASWRSGQNEDTREHLALIALMDSGSLVYNFSVSADFMDELSDQLQTVLDGLSIEELID